MSPLNFRWVDYSVLFFFFGIKFYFFYIHCCVLGKICDWFLIQTGDHKIPAHKFWLPIAGNIQKEVTKKGGPDLATKRGFLGKFSLELEWWYKVQTTKKSLQRRRKKSYIQTLSDKSWDSTELV